ncbi:MAG: penicillin-binding protein 2, partial [Planctomycetes bacterium]|nr:penicillin-binding protein 2 [Planctomycetota bacterium]
MNQPVIKHFERWGGQLFLGLLVMGMGIVLGRCWQLQCIEGARYQVQANSQMLRIIPQTARRGSIVDRHGRYMAMSIRTDSVRADPAIIKDFKDTAQKLSRILDLPEQELYQKLLDKQDSRFMRIKRDIPLDQAEQIRALKINGIVIEREYKRQYPMDELAAHVLGFTTIYGMGLEGIEAAFDEYLTGKIGLWRLNSDAFRRPIGTQQGSEPAQQGNHVVLCLDAMIQSYLEEQLVLTAQKFNAKGAIGIAMNPKTGEVLAMSTWPTFDPAHAPQSKVEHRRNRALTDPIEPGSTFKPFTVAAALEGGYVSVHETIFCHNGSYSNRRVFGTIGEYGNHSYGNLTVAEIVVNSSNIGTARISQKMGKTYFHKMVQKFGFGQKTGIDLTGEGRGILKPLDQWDRAQFDLTRLSFGQGPIMVTPIQLISAFCSLANGGLKVQPRVV